MPFDISRIDEKIPGSRYFTWREALHLGAIDALALPTDVQQSNIVRQASALDKVRDYFQRPITISSWLRPPLYNEKIVGGATHSRHMFGDATDFNVEGLTPEQVRTAIRAHGVYPGRGELNTPTWVHLDLSGTTWFNP